MTHYPSINNRKAQVSTLNKNTLKWLAVLLTLQLFVIGLATAQKIENNDSLLTFEQANKLGETMIVEDLLFLINKRVPFGSQIKRHKSILKKLKRLKLNILIQNETMIAAALTKKNKKTKEITKVMNIYYLFENKKLIKQIRIQKLDILAYKTKNQKINFEE
jgi:hypothetical protein